MIVIPLIQKDNYEELRYCLRAINKYHPEESVLIIGGLPNWIKNIIHVKHGDYSQIEFKARSIYEKIVEAFKHCDEMLFFNDDHHILAAVDYLHHKGPMTIEGRHPNGTYARLLLNTLNKFPGTMDYDTHCPIWYEKDAFKELSQLDWTKPYGYGIKTSYCNLNNINGTYYPDLKFKTTIGDIADRLYFSTSDDCNLSTLELLYPNKSKFEQ